MLTEIGSIGELKCAVPVQFGTPEPGWWAVTRVVSKRGEQVVETRTCGFIRRSFPSRTDRKTRTIQPRAEPPPPGATRGVAPGLTR